MKECSKCKETLPYEDFYKRVVNKDGYMNQCKSCRKQYKKLYYEKDKEADNERSRLWRLKNNERVREYNKEYYDKTDGNREKRKEYRATDHFKSVKSKWMAKDRSKNPHKYAWRTVLNNALKSFETSKKRSTIDMLGYSADELKSHLESLFTEGMSWDNHGEWHIDHKKPVSLFDPETDMSIVNALDNLQPLWAEVNLSKGNNYKEH